jgi:hypothetical protein
VYKTTNEILSEVNLFNLEENDKRKSFLPIGKLKERYIVKQL